MEKGILSRKKEKRKEKIVTWLNSFALNRLSQYGEMRSLSPL
jgi:hypothetical protein